MKKKRRKTSEDLRQAKIRAMQEMVYEDVCIYIGEEYNDEICHLMFNSPISDKLVLLVNQYYWGGSTVPFVSGHIADMLRSKYLQ